MRAGSKERELATLASAVEHRNNRRCCGFHHFEGPSARWAVMSAALTDWKRLFRITALPDKNEGGERGFLCMVHSQVTVLPFLTPVFASSHIFFFLPYFKMLHYMYFYRLVYTGKCGLSQWTPKSVWGVMVLLSKLRIPGPHLQTAESISLGVGLRIFLLSAQVTLVGQWV